LILKKETKNPDAMIIPGIASMRVEEHVKDPLAEVLLGNFATYAILPLILIYLRMTYGLLLEK